MTDTNELRGTAQPSGRSENAAEPDQDMDRRRKELIVFREAGVITEDELEEHMTRLRWGLP